MVVRLPVETLTGGRRSSEMSTFYGCCGSARGGRTDQGVTHVAMEATGIDSMPVYHVLLAHGEFEQALVCNAGQVKNVPQAARRLLIPNDRVILRRGMCGGGFASAGVAVVVVVVSVMSVPLWFRGDPAAARSFCLLALEIAGRAGRVSV